MYGYIYKTVNLKNGKIYIGQTNIDHMIQSHPNEYTLYQNEISNIISDPNFVGLNKDGSIEFIKEYTYDKDLDYVKLAVRISNSNGKYFARTLYTLNSASVNKYIEKGTIIKY